MFCLLPYNFITIIDNSSIPTVTLGHVVKCADSNHMKERETASIFFFFSHNFCTAESSKTKTPHGHQCKHYLAVTPKFYELFLTIKGSGFL